MTQELIVINNFFTAIPLQDSVSTPSCSQLTETTGVHTTRPGSSVRIPDQPSTSNQNQGIATPGPSSSSSSSNGNGSDNGASNQSYSTLQTPMISAQVINGTYIQSRPPGKSLVTTPKIRWPMAHHSGGY